MKHFPIAVTIFLLILTTTLITRAQDIAYTLKIDEPASHKATISVHISDMKKDSLTFAIPAWAPGRYVIYNFCKNIFDLKAFDVSGNKLQMRLLDKQTWRVYCPGISQIRIKYRVYANTLDGTFSKITENGASINGAGIFIYFKDFKPAPVSLNIEKPASWNLLTALPRQKNGQLFAENYDQLIDCPIEMGQLVVHNFEYLNRDHQLLFHSGVQSQILSHFINDLKKVIREQALVFNGNLPYDRYVFFYHLDENLEHTDGMEHANSTRILLRMNINNLKPDANTDPGYDNLIWLSAHEFFHIWNIKRLRPAGLGPFDYSKETYTPSLWIVEGLTSYYAYLALVRSGIYTREKLYSEFAGRIKRYETDPGKNHRTLDNVSRLTWLFKGGIPYYEETNIDETTYSYYYKGLIIGLLLDLKIRHLTGNRISLDDVMNAMYKKFYACDTKGRYFPGKGYHTRDFERLTAQMAGTDLQAFFDRCVRQIAELDYSILNYAGLELVNSESERHYRIVEMENSTDLQQQLRDDWLGTTTDSER